MASMKLESCAVVLVIAVAATSFLSLPVLAMSSADIAAAENVKAKIFAAISKGEGDDVDALKEALDMEGANVDVIGPGGQTPLLHAVLAGAKRCVALLLERNADTSIPDKDGYTVMHAAGFQGRAEIAKMLIDHGLDPNEQHKRDLYKPIHRACWGSEQRHTDTVKVFLDAGVSPLERGGEGGTTCTLMTNNLATKDLVKQWYLENHEL